MDFSSLANGRPGATTVFDDAAGTQMARRSIERMNGVMSN
jgi:hypothetical protein